MTNKITENPTSNHQVNYAVPATTAANITPYPYYPPPEDEISLIELWDILVQRKKAIVLSTLIVTIIAVIYALIQPPLYHATTTLLPPNMGDLDFITNTFQAVEKSTSNKNSNPLKSGVKIAYQIFIRNLGSNHLKKSFFEQREISSLMTTSKLPTDSRQKSVEQEIFLSFAQRFKLSKDKKDNDIVTLSLNWSDPTVAARLLNEYVAVVNQVSVNQLISNYKSVIHNQRSKLTQQIASKRKMAKVRRSDRLKRLKEGAFLANKISVLTQETGNSQMKEHDYRRGAKALNAQIEVLNKRGNDDPYIAGLRDLEEKLEQLSMIKVDRSKLQAVIIDQKAYPPTSRIKPKRRLIVTIGLVVGLMAGIFYALFANFLWRARKTITGSPGHGQKLN
ncbi:MAG: hypothetical protein HN353_06865 [Bdellovibrionales bacterium]|nr:hypothetical protein [Bdellovibrionales bacterium]MBT3525252.1 hypothetical protein [Bdellovibrionales bacterium]MBT7668894.1 hypothetical protein [Bdellovibrionales bacterium]